MGLFDVFSKGGKYFGKAIEPKCEYCEYGKRASDGDKVLCTKKGLVAAGFHCPKFLYSPLKRIPVKQLERVGWLEGDYEEKDFAAIQKKKEEEAKNAAAAAKAEKTASKNGKSSKSSASAKSDKSAPADKKDAKPAAEPKVESAAPADKKDEKPAAEPKVESAAPADTKDEKPAAEPKAESAAPADKKDEKPAAEPKAESAAPADAKPAAVQNPVTANDLASLAAMAEAAGAYNPEPVPAEETAQNNDNMSALSSM